MGRSRLAARHGPITWLSDLTSRCARLYLRRVRHRCVRGRIVGWRVSLAADQRSAEAFEQANSERGGPRADGLSHHSDGGTHYPSSAPPTGSSRGIIAVPRQPRSYHLAEENPAHDCNVLDRSGRDAIRRHPIVLPGSNGPGPGCRCRRLPDSVQQPCQRRDLHRLWRRRRSSRLNRNLQIRFSFSEPDAPRQPREARIAANEVKGRMHREILHDG
jgi:hypothetical protein